MTCTSSHANFVSMPYIWMNMEYNFLNKCMLDSDITTKQGGGGGRHKLRSSCIVSWCYWSLKYSLDFCRTPPPKRPTTKKLIPCRLPWKPQHPGYRSPFPPTSLWQSSLSSSKSVIPLSPCPCPTPLTLLLCTFHIPCLHWPHRRAYPLWAGCSSSLSRRGHRCPIP